MLSPYEQMERYLEPLRKVNPRTADVIRDAWVLVLSLTGRADSDERTRWRGYLFGVIQTCGKIDEQNRSIYDALVGVAPTR